jgi:hypothetical protein
MKKSSRPPTAFRTLPLLSHMVLCIPLAFLPPAISHAATASIEATKTATVVDVNGDGKTNAGDKIQYKIMVANTGDSKLTGVTLADSMKDGNGNLLNLTSGPTFVSASRGSAQGTLGASSPDTYNAIEKGEEISGSTATTHKALRVSVADSGAYAIASDDGSIPYISIYKTDGTVKRITQLTYNGGVYSPQLSLPQSRRLEFIDNDKLVVVMCHSPEAC